MGNCFSLIPTKNNMKLNVNNQWLKITKQSSNHFKVTHGMAWYLITNVILNILINLAPFFEFLSHFWFLFQKKMAVFGTSQQTSSTPFHSVECPEILKMEHVSGLWEEALYDKKNLWSIFWKWDSTKHGHIILKSPKKFQNISAKLLYLISM